MLIKQEKNKLLKKAVQRLEDKMAKLSMKGNGDIELVTKKLIEGMEASGMSCQLVDSSRRNDSIMLVFEKYYMRAKNRASLSIMLSEGEDSVFADIIGSGGGQGAIFSFSWGSEEDFVDSGKYVLTNMGFNTI